MDNYIKGELEMFESDDEEMLNTVYSEIAQSLGIEAAMTIYQLFRGQQVSFPLKLYHPDKIKEQIRKNYDGTNIKELARRYDYSEKTIRRIIGSKKQDE